MFSPRRQRSTTRTRPSRSIEPRAPRCGAGRRRARRLVALSEETGTSGATPEGRQGAINAGIAAVEKRPAEALTLYRRGTGGPGSGNSVWDVAMVGLDMAQLLDPADPDVAAAVAASREIMDRVGAGATLRLLDAAVTRTGDQPRQAERSAQASAEVGVASS